MVATKRQHFNSNSNFILKKYNNNTNTNDTTGRLLDAESR
jgi:hypothetical protein